MHCKLVIEKYIKIESYSISSFAIFLLILKPIMLLLLNKVRQDRLGEASFGVWGKIYFFEFHYLLRFIR